MSAGQARPADAQPEQDLARAAALLAPAEGAAEQPGPAQPCTPPPQADSVGKALRRVMNPAHGASLLRRGWRCLRQRGPQALAREVSYRVDLMRKGESWRFRADIPLRRELKAQAQEEFPRMPKVSIVVPLYNTPIKYLKQMIASVRAQSYKNWELVLVDASTPAYAAVGKTASRVRDSRIKYCRIAKNEGISANTNVGLAEAEGDYLALLDHDDVLSPNALYEAVKAINDGADVVYSDEIVLDEKLKNLGEYHFKPDFSPDTLRGCNYITHFLVFSRDLLARAGGGEDPAFDGAQDYDLTLRLTEHAAKVAHVPKVLYYWRRHAGSTAGNMEAKPYALEAGAKAVQAQLGRLGLAGQVQPIDGCPGAYRTIYEARAEESVSVLIPNKDHVEDLKRCLAGLYKNAGWSNLEVIVIENNSADPATTAFYAAAKEHLPGLRLVRYEGPFNFSAINNFGARFARGRHLLLLNNDVAFETPDFIREMVSYSQRPDVGAVGAKLFYPDGTVQHAGVFVGLGGSAGHNHKGHPRDSAGDMYRLATAQNMSAVTGACLMVKKSLYDALGGLDEENFAVAYNDVDFCLRLRGQGYLNVMTPFAAGIHYESKSRGDDTHAGGEKQARYEAEKARFVEKYRDLIDAGDPYYNPHFTTLYENYGYK